MKQNSGKISHGERSSALIAVLCLIFTAGIITTYTMNISKAASFDVAAHTQRQRSMIIGEGVANRVMWLLAADRSLYTDETLGETDYSDVESDRFLADTVKHTIDYHGEEVCFTIYDAVSGFDMSSDKYSSTISTMKKGSADDSVWEEHLTKLARRYADYVDSNDDAQDDAFEKDEYEELGMYPLPRNAAPQFREELLYLPGFRRVFPPDKQGRLANVRLIPPDNLADLSGAPALFSADRIQLKCYATQLEDDEIDEVLAAFKTWRSEEHVPLSDSLDETLIAKLNNFARTESGFYTVVIENSPNKPQPFQKLVFSFSGFNVSGPDNSLFQFLEWFYY